jgi:hypothetical protein
VSQETEAKVSQETEVNEARNYRITSKEEPKMRLRGPVESRK